MPASKLIIIALCLTLGSNQLFSQDYPFIKYTPKDGLISNRVQSFHQDSKGRIFFMSSNGLSVYDGARFLNYTVDDGLASSIVNDVLELSEDSFLIATNTRAVNIMVGGWIKTLQTKNGFCPVINKFYRDKDRVIYVASDQGLYRFDNNIFTPISFADNIVSSGQSFDDICEFGNFFLLKQSYKSNSNLLLIHKKTLQAQPFLVKGNISCTLPIREEQLLLVVANQKIVSLDLNAAEQGLTKYKKLPERFRFLARFSPVKIVSDSHQNLWCVTTNSVILLNQDGRSQIFDHTNGLDANNIRSVMVDKENVLWILTDGSGVVKLVNRNVEFQSADINALYHDRAGKTWMLSTAGRTLFCSDRDQTKKWKIDINADPWSLVKRKQSLLLFDRNSIYETEPVTGADRLSAKKIYSNATGLINFSRAELGDDENIYIPGDILAIVTPGNRVITHKLPGYVDQVSFDEHRQLWGVSRTGDLLCYKINPLNSTDPLTLTFSDKLAIPDPRSIVVDKTDKVWIGTRSSGIYCLEYKDKKLVSKKHWSTKEGLTDNFIYYLCCDKNNVIWAGTQGGLDKISCSGNIVESVTRNNNIYQVIQKIVIGQDNKVWAMGIGGIIRVRNDVAVASNYQPRVQIIRMMSGEKNLINLPERTKFSSQTHELTFDVAAPSFIDEKGVRFSYLLDGNGKGEWSLPSADASFRFINLQPARYTLHVKAFFPVANYKPQELIYDFTILPPWWQTWWFRTLLVLFFLTAMFLGVKAYYQNKLQKQKMVFEKQQAIQQERTRIAMEMHDDLGSGLTVIRYLAGGLFANPLPLIKENALKIETSAKQLVDNMNDIIWTIKSDNNSLSDVLGYIRKQAADMLENVGIDYEFDFPKYPQDVILENEQKRNLLLISKEIVHNVIKHAQATKVSITAKQNEKWLHLSFSDNGKGIGNKQNNYFGNGLKNIQQRAKQIDGNIEMINNGGTTIIVTMMLA